MLSAEFEPPPDFRPETFADLPPPPPDELVYDDRPIYAFDDFGPPPPPPPVQYVYVEDDDWRDLPPPPPPAEIGLLPVLGVAIPIAIGAVAYQHGFHHDGIAPRGQPRLRQAAFRAAAAAGQHQTCGAAPADCRGRRSCGQRGCRQASPSDWRAPRPTRRARRGSRQTGWRAASGRADCASCCGSGGSCRPGPSLEAASGSASGRQSSPAPSGGGDEASSERCQLPGALRPRSCHRLLAGSLCRP